MHAGERILIAVNEKGAVRLLDQVMAGESILRYACILLCMCLSERCCAGSKQQIRVSFALCGRKETE